MTDNQLSISEIQEELRKANADIEIGDWYYSRHYGFAQITHFTKLHSEKNTEQYWVQIHYKTRSGRLSHDSLASFMESDSWNKLTPGDTPESIEAEALDMLVNGVPEENLEVEQTSALATTTRSTKDLQTLQQQLEAKAARSEMLKSVIESKMRAMVSHAHELQSQLKYVQKVLNIFEAYLGVYEEITVLKEGTPAPLETPITIRQLILYMDEEVGDIESKSGVMGIDFTRVEDFDAWLLKDDHYKVVVPEERCIVALKPSRTYRAYSENWYYNALMNAKNNETYILIRNGEKLWRIYHPLKLQRTLFPEQEEYQKLMQEMERYGGMDSTAANKDLDWKAQAVLLQGLIERTEVMVPHHPDVNLFKPESFENGWINLIRDAEQINLPDGHLPYKVWFKQLNSRIKRGSRIIMARAQAVDSPYSSSRWEHQRAVQERFRGNYRNNHPPYPEAGVYTVWEVVPNGKRWNGEPAFQYKIKYNPQDIIYHGWESKEREQQVSIYIDDDYENILNYDEITLEDVDYYIGNRIERRSYQEILPVLYAIRHERMQELEQEKHFVKLVAEQEDVEEDKVWEAVNWWKTKVINKRPIAEDDAKAWRMIRKRLKKES